MAKKLQLPKIDLSRYNDKELPGHIIDIIKNALVVFEGDVNKVSKWYNLDKEKVSEIFVEYYLIITQIIQSKMKSVELDNGIDNAILLITEHINELQTRKTNPILRDNAVNAVNRMTDRMIALKKEYNNTFDILVNQMNTQALKERQVRVLENGKPDTAEDYIQNIETVYSKLKNCRRRVRASNIKTHEILEFDTLRACADHFQTNPDYLRTKIKTKKLWQDYWAFEYCDGLGD